MSPDRAPIVSSVAAPLQAERTSLRYIEAEESCIDEEELSVCSHRPSDPALTPEEAKQAVLDITAAVDAELADYLRDSWSTKLSDDPLYWWRTVGSVRYPHLAYCARYCFSMLGTSATVERAFKFAKFFSREERGRTGDDLIDMLTVLAYAFAKDPSLYMKLFE